MIYLADGKPVTAMVRGDREANEIKLKNLTWTRRPGTGARPQPSRTSPAGRWAFSGPVGLEIPIYADQELWLEPALVVGANKGDYHLVNLNMEPRRSQGGQGRPAQRDPGRPLPQMRRQAGVRPGHRGGPHLPAGHQVQQSPWAPPTRTRKATTNPIVMGSYGIGVSRIVAAAIEQGHDENGIIFPIPIAPVAVAVLPMKPKGESVEVAQRLHDELWAKGVDCLLDDRDVRPGVKFKDGELLGIPIRLVVGPKGLKNNEVEVKFRASGEMEMMPLDEAVDRIAALVKEAGGQML
jgi:prolyl-tRNA synthetase